LAVGESFSLALMIHFFFGRRLLFPFINFIGVGAFIAFDNESNAFLYLLIRHSHLLLLRLPWIAYVVFHNDPFVGKLSSQARLSHYCLADHKNLSFNSLICFALKLLEVLLPIVFSLQSACDV